MVGVGVVWGCGVWGVGGGGVWGVGLVGVGRGEQNAPWHVGARLCA